MIFNNEETGKNRITFCKKIQFSSNVEQLRISLKIVNFLITFVACSYMDLKTFRELVLLF